MKFFHTLFWVICALLSLAVALLYLPLFWVLDVLRKTETKNRLAWGYAHWWGRAMLATTGSRVEVTGAEKLPPGSVVVAGNHQSAFDIMLVLGYIDKPLAFIAKKEIARWPLISTWMRHLKCLFLDRRDIRQAARVFQQAVAQLQQGSSMVIFPEGTRSRSVALGEFKRGSMKLPLRAGVPIVPISINGTYKIFEANGKAIAPARVQMVIGDPVYPDRYSDNQTGTVIGLVRERIAAGLAAIVADQC